MSLLQHPLSVREYGASPGSHSHEHVQVLVGLQGVLELEVRGRGLRIGPGDGCVVPAGERHDFESAQGSSCLVLDSEDARWAECTAAPARPQQTLLLASYLAQALSQPGSLAAVHGPALLLDSWAPQRTPGTRPQRAIDWQALAQWTQHHLHLPLSVADLAAQVFLSSSQFALRCRQAQGVSAMQWLRQQRLARARQLREAGLGVAEAAHRSGYRSPSALTAALRRQRAL